MATHVHSVTKINTDSHGAAHMIGVLATGMVNTGGWSNIRLALRPNAPKDLNLHLDFLGDPPAPGTIVTQAFVEVNARFDAEKAGLIGVVVYAANNEMNLGFI
jgi:hypothetical protein